MAINQAGGPFNYGDTVTVGPFPLGVNNIDNALGLKPGELVSAFNLDINRDGIATRRDGYSLALAATDAHSLWARGIDTAFYASSTDLKMLTVNGAGTLAASTLRAGAMQARRSISYVDVNGTVYYSNGLVTGVIRSDNTNHAWGVERPARNPVLTRASGNLPAGRYLVALQYINDLGEVGGVQQAVAIDIIVDSSIVVSGIPVAVSADVAQVSLYASSQNGDVLFRYGDYPIGTTSVTVSAAATTGVSLYGYLCDVMPPCDLLEYYNGRIYGAVGSTIVYTNPLMYGLYERRSNFILEKRPVTMMKAVEDGIYIGTDEEVVFYHGGEPKSFVRKHALPYGAIPGTGVTFPKYETNPRGQPEPLTVGWFTERGFVKGQNSGKLHISDGAEHHERVMVGMFSAGAALYREKDGLRQVVGTMRGPTKEALTSTDYAEAEVRRNGELL